MRRVKEISIVIVILLVLAVGVCHGTDKVYSEMRTPQNKWQIIDATTSADNEVSDLAVTERTYTTIVAAIAAAASPSDGDGEISIFPIPDGWNGIRLRAIGITADGTATYQIYLGTLALRGTDCEMVNAGQLAWVVGTQTSIYDQITFTSGGTYVPKPGDIVTGNSSGKTAVVVSTTRLGGTWVGGNASGTITYRSASGTFTSSETVKIIDSQGVTRADVLTHAASDLVDFELADAVTVTAYCWTKSWGYASNPDTELVAEASLDLMGADVLIAVCTTASADCKLLGKGF